MIIIDQIKTHDTSNIGDNTQPPGVSGLLWCHIGSTTSYEELAAYLTANSSTINQSAENIRTPALGSLMTYAGLDPDQRDAAIAAGASPQRQQFVIAHIFDTPGPGSMYEP